MDRMSVERRSKIMAAVRSRDTIPERVVRKWLHAHGYRFRVCDKRIVGHPDIVLLRYRTLIEVRGCFWHRHGWEWDGRKPVHVSTCAGATTPKTNRAFWNAKFRANVRRDAAHMKAWTEDGWTVIVVWECGLATAADRKRTFEKVSRWIDIAFERV